MRPNIIKHFLMLAVSMLITIFLTAFTNDNGTKNKKDSAKVAVDDNKPGLNKSPQFELNPQAIPFVSNYLSKESEDLESMKKWCKPYFAIYEKVLSSNNLPVELKYLSVIESSLQAHCVSPKGALGPWQLMPDEAKRFGLKMTDDYDERTNFNKSTA